jgi:hypothetical protein
MGSKHHRRCELKSDCLLFPKAKAEERLAHCSPLIAHCSLLLLWRQCQAEYRNHSFARDVHFALPGSRQVERLAVFAAIDFGLRSPGLLHISTIPLDRVGHVEPELQVAAAEFALGIFLVAGALPCFFDLHFVVGKLRNVLSAGSGHFASRQGTCS